MRFETGDHVVDETTGHLYMFATYDDDGSILVTDPFSNDPDKLLADSQGMPPIRDKDFYRVAIDHNEKNLHGQLVVNTETNEVGHVLMVFPATATSFVVMTGNNKKTMMTKKLKVLKKLPDRVAPQPVVPGAEEFLEELKDLC